MYNMPLLQFDLYPESRGKLLRNLYKLVILSNQCREGIHTQIFNLSFLKYNTALLPKEYQWFTQIFSSNDLLMTLKPKCFHINFLSKHIIN